MFECTRRDLFISSWVMNSKHKIVNGPAKPKPRSINSKRKPSMPVLKAAGRLYDFPPRRGGGYAILQRRNERNEISCLNRQNRTKIGGGYAVRTPISNTGRYTHDYQWNVLLLPDFRLHNDLFAHRVIKKIMFNEPGHQRVKGKFINIRTSGVTDGRTNVNFCTIRSIDRIQSTKNVIMDVQN